MRHYWVDPQNTSRIEGHYVIGDAVVIDGETVTANLRGAAPGVDIYEALEDNTLSPGDYRTLTVLTTFTGTVKDAGARVQETRRWDRIPADDLLAARLVELEGIVATVDAQGIEVSALSGGARAVKTEARAVRQYQNLRLTKAAIPDATAVKMKDQWDAWFPCSKGDAEEILTSVAIFHEAVITSNAESHDDELHRLHGICAPLDPASPEYATAWDNLANHDLSTGWPAAPKQP